jgi:hypothetical protein
MGPRAGGPRAPNGGPDKFFLFPDGGPREPARGRGLTTCKRTPDCWTHRLHGAWTAREGLSSIGCAATCCGISLELRPGRGGCHAQFMHPRPGLWPQGCPSTPSWRRGGTVHYNYPTSTTTLPPSLRTLSTFLLTLTHIPPSLSNRTAKHQGTPGAAMTPARAALGAPGGSRQSPGPVFCLNVQTSHHSSRVAHACRQTKGFTGPKSTGSAPAWPRGTLHPTTTHSSGRRRNTPGQARAGKGQLDHSQSSTRAAADCPQGPRPRASD